MVGAGGQTLYYIDEHEIEFEKLINQQLPKVPRQVNFTAHWLAIEGVQPMVPQNPLPSEIKSLPAAVRGATTSMLGNDILSLGSKMKMGKVTIQPNMNLNCYRMVVLLATQITVTPIKIN